jgi:hypothetical protein
MRGIANLTDIGLRPPTARGFSRRSRCRPLGIVFTCALEHDPEKLTDFSDKIMRQNKDVDVARDST